MYTLTRFILGKKIPLTYRVGVLLCMLIMHSYATCISAQIGYPNLPLLNQSTSDKHLSHRPSQQTAPEDQTFAKGILELRLCPVGKNEDACVMKHVPLPVFPDGAYELQLMSSQTDKNPMQVKKIASLIRRDGATDLMRTPVFNTYVPDDNRPLTTIAPYKFLLSMGVLAVMLLYFSMLIYQHTGVTRHLSMRYSTAS